MKKLFYFLALSLFFVFSCNQENGCSDCEDKYTIKTLKIDNTDYSVKSYSTSDNKNFIFNNEDERLIVKLSEKFNILSLLDKDVKLVSIVMFENLINSSSLDAKYLNPKGIQLYYLENEILKTKVFEKTDKSFIEKLELRSTVNKISSNEFNEINNLLFNTNTIINVIDKNIKHNHFNISNLATNIKKLNKLKVTPYHSSACSSPCGELTGRNCDYDMMRGHYYCQTKCLLKVMEINFGSKIINSIFILNKLRIFRDNFLSNTKNGHIYIEKYELVSDIFENSNTSVNMDFAIRTFSFINETIIPIVDKLTSSEVDNNPLYNEIEKNKMLDYLAYSKTFSPSIQVTEVVNDLIIEVSNNYGKNKNEIKNYLNN